jgi:hypothetical protein
MSDAFADKRRPRAARLHGRQADDAGRRQAWRTCSAAMPRPLLLPVDERGNAGHGWTSVSEQERHASTQHGMILSHAAGFSHLTLGARMVRDPMLEHPATACMMWCLRADETA